MRELPEVSFLAGRRELTAIADRLLGIRARVARATTRRRVVAPEVILVGAAKRQPLSSLEEAWEAARLMRTAPITKEMILNYVAEHNLGLPRSY